MRYWQDKINITLQKTFGCFNHSRVTSVAAELHAKYRLYNEEELYGAVQIEFVELENETPYLLYTERQQEHQWWTSSEEDWAKTSVVEYN